MDSHFELIERPLNLRILGGLGVYIYNSQVSKDLHQLSSKAEKAQTNKQLGRIYLAGRTYSPAAK